MQPITTFNLQTTKTMREYIVLGVLALQNPVMYADTVPKKYGSISKTVYGFNNPQDSTRTKTWWFHGHTPASIEGMTKDLEAFKQVGIGGVVFYDQTHGTPDPNTEKAMSNAWWNNIYHAASETRRLGLGLEFHVSNGFVAGGPWITPQKGMKRLECNETLIKGGKAIDTLLSAPQNRYNYYRDVKILAIPTFDNPQTVMHVKSLTPGVDAGQLFGKGKAIEIKAKDAPVIIEIDYGEAVTLRSMEYNIGVSGKATTSATNVPAPPQETFIGTGYRILPPAGQLQWSEDGEVYSKVCDIKPLYRAHESYSRKTLSFDPVKARFFRIVLDGWDGCSEGKSLRVWNVKLSSDPKINEYEYKAAYISEYIEPTMKSPGYNVSDIMTSKGIKDLTSMVTSDGRLRWNAPEGNWKILRISMVPTGGSLKHGRKNMMGLECDKMSAEAATLQFNSYFARILDSLENRGFDNLKGMVMDSHEAGSQNWTDDFMSEFARRRGYSLETYLPVMAGYVVDDVRKSEGVLYDVRQTIAELISERYYGTLDSLCRSRGITFTAQATGNAQCIVAIPIEAKGKVQKPQGEFWLIHPDGNYDTKESSSAAHLYDKQVASAEAFTDGNINTMPSDMKKIADIAYSFGINEFVICASAHQPDKRVPGFSGGRVYATYSRNNTWWSKSRSFWDYQARISYVMRQGRPVADLCIYLGNNAPVRIMTNRLPVIPAGYDFDAFTEDALLNRMSTHEGRATLPGGQSYAMMVLPRSGEISFDALSKIAAMVKQGMTLYGNKPKGSPSGKDTGKEKEYRSLVDELWNSPDGHYGKGRVLTGMTLAEAVEKAGITPDVSGPKLHFAHRETADGDIYFLYNHSKNVIDSTFTFRSNHRHAQLWDAVTGKRYSLKTKEGSARIRLMPGESCFAVFTDKREKLPEQPVTENEIKVNGPWIVEFNIPGKGMKSIRTDSLEYWNNSSDPDIKYYSGTVKYTTSITCRKDKPAAQLKLSPNNCVSKIYINGNEAATVWGAPWTADLSGLLKKGNNELKIEMTNSWHNRLVGDLKLDADKRQSTDPEYFVTENDTLTDAGLKDGVTLILEK